jgi:hypothetical protein
VATADTPRIRVSPWNDGAHRVAELAPLCYRQSTIDDDKHFKTEAFSFASRPGCLLSP